MLWEPSTPVLLYCRCLVAFANLRISSYDIPLMEHTGNESFATPKNRPDSASFE